MVAAVLAELAVVIAELALVTALIKPPEPSDSRELLNAVVALASAALAVVTAALALVDAVLAVVTALAALFDAVVAVALAAFDVVTAADALVDAVLAVLTAFVELVEAVLAVAIAVSAVVLAVSAVVFAVTTSKLASCVAKLFCVKLSFRSSALIAEPGKNVALRASTSVSRKRRMATLLAGAVLKLRVVALAKVNAVVAVPSSDALTSACFKYSNVIE